MSKKGQISTIDLTVAFTLVLLILLTTMEVWTLGLTKIFKFNDKRSLDRKALEVSELLIKTPGMPAEWQTLDSIDARYVSTIGFAKRDNILDASKLEKAGEITYENLTKILGLTKEDVHITVTDIQNSSLPVLYEIGEPTNRPMVIMNRYGLLNDTIVEVGVRVYFPEDSFMTT